MKGTKKKMKGKERKDIQDSDWRNTAISMTTNLSTLICSVQVYFLLIAFTDPILGQQCLFNGENIFHIPDTLDMRGRFKCLNQQGSFENFSPDDRSKLALHLPSVHLGSMLKEDYEGRQ